MRAKLELLVWTPIFWCLSAGGRLLGQTTLKELESGLQVSRGRLEQGGEPTLGLFTILFVASILLVVGVIVLGLRYGQQRHESTDVGEEVHGEEESYFLHLAFLATGYAAIIIMLAYVPPALTPGLGTATRWTLIVAGVFISVAHLLAAKDEQSLPPSLKYLFTGSVVLAAIFFHLAFKQWSFLQFSDPFYQGAGPYVALGVIILLVVLYSVYITCQHAGKRRPDD